jgi:hypothetical protein
VLVKSAAITGSLDVKVMWVARSDLEPIQTTTEWDARVLAVMGDPDLTCDEDVAQAFDQGRTQGLEDAEAAVAALPR